MAIAAFLLAALLLNAGLNFALYPYTYARVDVHHLETGTYDDLFIGASHGKSCINPVKVDEVTGRSSINLCIGGQYMIDSYFIAKEACRVNRPKRIVYELDPGYWITDMAEDTSFGQTYHELPWSAVKAEYFLAKFLKKDFRNTLFPWYAYRSQLTQMAENIKTRTGSMYKNYGTECFSNEGQSYEESGFIRTFPVEGMAKDEESLTLWDETLLREDSTAYFEKLVKLCEKEDVELVVITTPVPAETLAKYGEYAEADVFFAEYFAGKGIRYMNFNENHPGYTLEEYSDWEGHMYGETADRFSVLLGEALK